MVSTKYKVLVAHFDDDYDETTSIKVVEMDDHWVEFGGQAWIDDYNANHEIKIAKAEIYSLDYLKDHWVNM